MGVSRLHVFMAVLAMLMWLWTLTVKARVPLSIAVIGMALFSLIRLHWKPFPIHLWKGAPQALWRFFKTPAYSLPSLFFIAYAVSALTASDFDRFWSTRLQLSIQTLGIPAAFLLLSAIYIRFRDHLYMALGLFASVVALGVGVYLGSNNDAIIVALGQGRVVPTPNGHVRFAMTLAVTAIAMWWYTLAGFSTKRSRDIPSDWLGTPRAWLRGFALVFAVILTVVLHLVAIRTGLVMFYLGFAVLLTRVLLPRVGWKGVAVALVLAVVFAGVAATQIPTLSRKLAYVNFDLAQIGKKGQKQYSDAGRLASIQAGFEVIRAHPFTGAPNGDVKAAMLSAYAKTGNPTIQHPPHNQFIYSWVAAGLLGFLGVCAVLIGPLMDSRFWRKPLLAEGWIMIASMFTIEAPLESDIGIGLCLLALYLPKIGEGLPREEHEGPHRVAGLSSKPNTETATETS